MCRQCRVRNRFRQTYRLHRAVSMMHMNKNKELKIIFAVLCLSFAVFLGSMSNVGVELIK